MALSGAMIWPGIGHFIAGSYYLGLFWFTLSISTVVAIVGLLEYPQWIVAVFILLVIAAVITLLQFVDAFRCARKSRSAMLGEPALRYVVAVVLMIIAMYWQHAAIAYLQENVFEICYTPTPSMAPLLQAGDRFVTFKSMPIKRWDIVGFNVPPQLSQTIGDHWMKRVVGLPGEQVELTPKGMFINGKLIDLPPEAGPYLATDRWEQPLTAPARYTAGNGCWGRPILLKDDEYYLLGDNTTESTDARYWPSIHGHQLGAMPADQITCKVVAICWPPERWRVFR
jgi:signal peptidase I